MVYLSPVGYWCLVDVSSVSPSSLLSEKFRI